MIFAIYSRKSKFTGKGESIENQIELCRQYIDLHYNKSDIEDVVIYEDEGFSGGNTKRPMFKKLMADSQKKKLNAIICYRLDRVSRNIGDFAKLIEELNELNISFISIKEQFDTDSPIGRAMMYIASVFSQLERETIAERIRDNMHELAKTGRWLGGNTPTGYKSEQIQKISIEGKVRKAYKLTVINGEADLVRLIFKKFLEFDSLTMLETYLLQNNIKTKNGNNFTRFTIKNILQNPVYMMADKEAWKYFKELGVEIYADENEFSGKNGVMAYNKTLQKTGKANVIRDIKDWIIAVGKHKGLISGKDWIRVQSILIKNKSKAYRKPKSHEALLSGLLYCDKCTSYMRPKLRNKINSAGERAFSYLCETKEKSHKQNCDIKNLNGNLLDSKVCDQIKNLIEDKNELIKYLKKAERTILNENKTEYYELKDLNSSYVKNEKEIKKLVESLVDTSDMPANIYIIDKINDLHRKNQIIKSDISELERHNIKTNFNESELTQIKHSLIEFSSVFDLMEKDEKRKTFRKIIRKITWNGEEAKVYF